MVKVHGLGMGLQLLKTESDARYEVYFNGQHLGYFYLEIDGFYVFVPKSDIGYWSEFSLRMIADKLEELNKQHNEAITLFFKENE
jgi:hypothetical protein